jgi:hypothetical protein
MEPHRIGLRDVSQGSRPSRLRLLAPLRYLAIRGPEKTAYDRIMPLAVGVAAWAIYTLIEPKPALFGSDGLLRFTRDLLIMAVPFMVGALAAVAMGTTGSLDRRPPGAELVLDGERLTLRQFTCYLLGYLCFLGLLTLGVAVGAEVMREPLVAWTAGAPVARDLLVYAGTLALSLLLSALSITVLWALYFLTIIVNR